VMLVDEFPMTVTGKIRKIQMREESAAQLGLVGTGHGATGVTTG
jgi:fatty-acyl-CoA synthase